jgi:hypothetical protein
VLLLLLLLLAAAATAWLHAQQLTHAGVQRPATLLRQQYINVVA